MKYRKLGNSGLRVSEISLGSMFYGGAQYQATDQPVSREDASKVIRRAIDLDINHLDCADIYGAYGNAEEILGKTIAEYDRDHLIISSKVMLPMGRHELDRGLSRKHLKKSINQTLERMQTGYIDIYYCHRYDHLTPLPEVIQTMNTLIEQGKIHYWATSNWSPAELERAMAIANDHGFQGPIADQTKYNLNRRYPLEVALPYTLDYHNIGITAYKILAGGIFTSIYAGKKYEDLTDEEKKAILSEFPQTGEELREDYMDRLQQYISLATELDLTPAQLTYAWTLKNKRVSTAIMSTSKPDRVDENIVAIDVNLSDENMEKINQLFPDTISYYDTYSYIDRSIDLPSVHGKITEEQMKF